jgi:uncharacterized protein YgbK (DUF1537 family)
MLALADDLSGAAETAVALMAGGATATIALHAGVCAHRTDVLVVDLDSRHCAPEEAGAPFVFKKIDSLLRGNVAAEVAALGTVVVAPALPVLGRTVAGGVLHVDGVPLHATSAWHAETAAPPPSLAELLGACSLVDLETVRSGRLAAALGAGITVCDADLDAIAAAAPLNKAALRAGGHDFPGHTELLAHLTGTDEVSMMLSTPKVKVIHVTTHRA